MIKLVRDSRNKFFQGREIPVVRAQSTGQSPDPFDRVELRAVRRQKIQAYYVAMFGQPGREQFCMMPSSIVQNNDHAAVFATMTHQLSQKRAEAQRVEGFFLADYQAARFGTDGPENSDLLSSRRMQQHGIDILGRNPHGTA